MKEIRVAIHQPNFIPWLGYFHKMSMVDYFVLFDDVQVPQGKSFASRALVKTNAGELWITVPTLSRSDKESFRLTGILNSNWRNKTLKTIKLAYQKAPYFNAHFTAFSEIYMAPAETLFEFNYSLLLFLRERFGLKTEFRLSSELGTDPSLAGAEKILSILQALSATTYVSGKGSGSRRYINENEFRDLNIKLVWQEFKNTPYQQLYGPFIPNLSSLDFLFNCGGNNPDFENPGSLASRAPL
jgi:hypothetical protein